MGALGIEANATARTADVAALLQQVGLPNDAADR
jgi:hypothetical protein